MFDKIYGVALSLPMSRLSILLKGLLAVILLSGFFLFFYQLKKFRVLHACVDKVKDKILQSERKRQKENRTEKEEAGEHLGRMTKIDRSLVYSGLSKIFPWLSVEVYIVLLTAAVASAFFGIQMLSHSFPVSIMGGMTAYLMVTGVKSILMYRNYMSVENDLLNLLNLLKNYSISADEITLIFYRVAKYLNDPLKTALRECYYEGKTTGNNDLALFHMMEKIEHPKFKELVRNIEICGRYNADYSAILTNMRKTFQDYISAKKEQRSNNKAELLTFGILVGAGIFCFSIIGGLVNISIWERLATTTAGRFAVLYFLSVIAAFLWNIFFVDRK